MGNPEHEQTLREALQAGDHSVDLSGFDLSQVHVSAVRLKGAKLCGAHLRGADFSGGHFPDCDFRDAVLKKARATLGDFRNANFSGADLSSADLNGSVLTGANLTKANLSRATLVKTHLDRADLTGANLDGTDLRGVRGLTKEQLESAASHEKAILDERMMAAFGRKGDTTAARHGRPQKKRSEPTRTDLVFATAKPSFGDLFQITGERHPDYPPTGDYGFGELTDLGIEQVDDYFAVCVDGDPVIWIYPLVNGQVVEHHTGLFDGLRIELGARSYAKRYAKCVTRIRETLQIPLVE